MDIKQPRSELYFRFDVNQQQLNGGKTPAMLDGKDFTACLHHEEMELTSDVTVIIFWLLS